MDLRRNLTPAVSRSWKQTRGNVRYVVHSPKRPVTLLWKQLWPSDRGIYCREFEGVRVQSLRVNSFRAPGDWKSGGGCLDGKDGKEEAAGGYTGF